MLVLTRLPQESIVIPAAAATVRVLSASGRAVRLGVAAPRHVRVVRGELYDPLLGSAGALHPNLRDRHALRNVLNNLSLGLSLLEAQLAARPTDAHATLARVRAEYLALRDALLAAPAVPAAEAVGG